MSEEGENENKRETKRGTGGGCGCELMRWLEEKDGGFTRLDRRGIQATGLASGQKKGWRSGRPAPSTQQKAPS